MKIVLKDADFSQSGIPTPHEVVLDGSKWLNNYTGELVSNSNTSRGADISEIPLRDNKVINNSAVSIFACILFFASDGTYLGCVSYDGGATYAILGAGDNFRIDNAAHYMKPVDATHMTEMSDQEVVSLKANAAYWMFAATAGSGTVDSISIALEIVE